MVLRTQYCNEKLNSIIQYSRNKSTSQFSFRQAAIWNQILKLVLYKHWDEKAAECLCYYGSLVYLVLRNKNPCSDFINRTGTWKHFCFCPNLADWGCIWERKVAPAVDTTATKVEEHGDSRPPLLQAQLLSTPFLLVIVPWKCCLWDPHSLPITPHPSAQLRAEPCLS